MGNCAAKPLALDDAPLPLEKPPSMHGSSVDGNAYKEEEEEAAATAKLTSPEHEPLLESKEVAESNKNGTSEAQKDVAVSETHTLASEPAEGNVQGTVVVTPQALTKDDGQAHIEDKDEANAAVSEANVEPEDSKAKVQVEAQDIDAVVKDPKDKEATIIATPQENDATVTKPKDNEAPADSVDSSATKAPKDKKKGDVFHALFSMYDNLVKKH